MHRITSRLGTAEQPRLAFGGDYNPEQWPESVWPQDIALMQQAGVNLVSVGIFSWALLEPKEGLYEFAWLDRVLDLLRAGGIKVDLANASASPPPWFSRKYPESLPVTEDGVRLSYGSRQAFCGSNPDYRRAAAALTSAIVDRYSDHPAVVMWHVHNEYACHNPHCYCDLSAAAFRTWLQRRYDTLTELNESWGTTFWSQRYYDWEEILPPRRSGTWVNPTQQLDFWRFSSDELLDCYRAEAAIIRARSSHPVTTNFMSFFKPLDYFQWAPELDIVSNDHYLMAADANPAEHLALSADLIRGLADGRPWLLMEHSTSAVNWQPRNVAKAPRQMLRNSFSHVARGSDGALFFQWRASGAGAEKFHSGLVPHAGTDTKIWREVVELGAALKAISPIAGTTVARADVAIMHDWNSWWAAELDSHPSVDVGPMPMLRQLYSSLWRRAIRCDVVHPGNDLTGYKVVLVPALYLISDEHAQSLQRFVAGGGTVLVTFFSGIVDERDHIRMGGYPGAFTELLGLRVEEFFPLLATSDVGLAGGGRATVWTELATVTSAEVIDSYGSASASASADARAVAGCPAITRNSHGSGVAWYLGTRLADAELDALLDRVLGAADVRPEAEGLPAGVEIVRRVGASGTFSFVINHTTSEVSLPGSGTELITGQEVASSMTVPGGEVRVLHQS